MKAAEIMKLDWSILNPRYTYMFELISPFNRIIVPYREISLRHIGTRDNETLQELDTYIGIPKPKEFSFKSLEECLQAAQKLPYNNEGYVIVDEKWNRIKIKSPAYVAVQHLKNDGVLTKRRILEMLLKNKHEELLTYFPEYSNKIQEVQDKIKQFEEAMEAVIQEAQNTQFATRKDLAEFAKRTPCPAYVFSL